MNNDLIPEKVTINGIKVLPFKSKFQLLKYLENIDYGILFAINARKIMTSPEHIKDAINHNIGYIDGFGTIWALRRKGYKGELTRIAGVDLWLDIIKHFNNKKYYFIGAKEDVIISVVNSLRQDFPWINIAGYMHGYFNFANIDNIADDINKSKADFVFVAMGSPKQENVMIELSKKYRTLYMGLGGSFDVYSGNVPRAPVFFQKTGLEGLYRIINNPKRLFDRKIFYFEYFRKLIKNDF